MRSNLNACLILFFLHLVFIPNCFSGIRPIINSNQSTWYVATTGNNTTGDGSQGNPWASIQYANDNALVHDGDIISVAPGTYSEKIIVTKSLKFYGPNYNISPNPTTANRNSEALINAVTAGDDIFEVRTFGTNVEIKGFKFMNGSPLHDGHLGRNGLNDNDIIILFEKNWTKNADHVFAGSLTRWKNITIKDNFFDSIYLTSTSIAIQLFDGNDPLPAPQHPATVIATITDNRINGTNWNGISLNNILSATVLRNEIRNVYESGIKLAGGIGNATVSQNYIQNANTSATPDVGGIKIYGSEFTGTVNITNNTIINSLNGFAVLDGADITGKDVHVFNNSFDNTNTAHAIYHGGTGNLDATCNWLGTSNVSSAVARIYGPVSYNPFVTNGADYSSAQGFQPLPGTCNTQSSSPTFTRTILTSALNRPWEILYGPDSMLWITQSNGRVSRVNPNTGIVNTIYTAPDYFGGVSSQNVPLPCGTFQVAACTYSMALHPDFINTPYLYYIYSYNAGTSSNPVSKYKVRRLTWNAATQTVSNPVDIIPNLPLDLTHDGMRMLIAVQNNIPYIYITVGDGTIDNDNCYPPNNNDNLRAQDWNSMFGKILRFNIDGSIPLDNPIAGSPIFTRGHRNPLGLAYNPATNILYSSENGKSSDDELNIIQKGRNYGLAQGERLS